MSTTVNTLHPKAQRTRDRLFTSFKELVLSIPYAQLNVEHLLRHAEISRSTFYQHFDGKDDLLVQSMSPLLRVLAQPTATAFRSAPSTRNPRPLDQVLEHFWENRRYAKAIFDGAARTAVIEQLARLHLDRIHLEAQRTGSTSKPLTARRLASRAAAHAQIGTLLDWLTGRTRADVATIAQTMESLRPC